MANGLKGESRITVGGKDYTLALDINALCEIEAETGYDANALGSALSAMSSPGAKVSMTLLRAVFRAMLQKHHPGITLHETGELLSGMSSDATLGALSETMTRAAPADEGKGRRQQRKAKRGAG